MKNEYEVKKITNEKSKPWLVEIHYAKIIPCILYAYGLFNDGKMLGVVTYGTPSGAQVSKSICNGKFYGSILELNRLCLLNNEKNEASILVSKSLKMLPKPKVIISYSDTSMNHVGYVYQATNWIYTGLTDKRKTEWHMKGSNKKSKTLCEQYTLEQRLNDDRFYVKERPRKHRYIYFVGSKKDKKIMRDNLKYNIYPYPKEKNEYYKVDKEKSMFD